MPPTVLKMEIFNIIQRFVNNDPIPIYNIWDVSFENNNSNNFQK
jgi:hypothetical protein